MSDAPRVLLSIGSVGAIAGAAGAGALLAPAPLFWWLLLCAFFATVAAFHGVTSNPRDLAAALFLALPPVAALAAEGSPAWLIGPLAALLLLGGELCALAWTCEGSRPLNDVQRRRLRASLGLALGAAGAGLAVGVLGGVALPGGTVALVGAAIVAAALARRVFGVAG